MTSGKESIAALPSMKCDCPVCFDTFKDPKSLVCGHSICAECAKGFEASIKCPTCRHESPPWNMLKTNFALKDLLDQIKSKEYSITTEVKAKLNDGKYVCGECSERFEIGQLWVCEECQVYSVCSTCILKNHRSHQKIENLKELFEKRKDEVFTWRRQMQDIIGVIFKDHYPIDVICCEVEDLIQEISSSLIKEFDLRSGIVSKSRQEQYALLEEIVTFKLGDLISNGQLDSFLDEMPKKVELARKKQNLLKTDALSMLELLRRTNQAVEEILERMRDLRLDATCTT